MPFGGCYAPPGMVYGGVAAGRVLSPSGVRARPHPQATPGDVRQPGGAAFALARPSGISEKILIEIK
jgi:hypothetical protein